MKTPRQVRFPRVMAALFAFGAAAVAASACGPASESDSGAVGGGFDRTEGRAGLRGLELDRPLPVEPFTLTGIELTGTEPVAFDFPDDVSDKLALFFFGFTNCPDICPVQMAVLSQALANLSHAERSRVRVVFASVDPERDTPEQIRQWLDTFDRRFIGLRDDLDSVNAVQVALGLPPSVMSPGGEPGHATPVVAVYGDSVRAMYPMGVRQTDWRHDLPIMISRAAGDGNGG